jgi:hypothetical protein
VEMREEEEDGVGRELARRLARFVGVRGSAAEGESVMDEEIGKGVEAEGGGARGEGQGGCEKDGVVGGLLRRV